MARYNFFFEKAGMTRVDLPEDTRFEAQLRELESLGFRREMLGSRRQNMKIMSRLGKNGLEMVSRFALNNCVGNKFKAVRLEAKVRALDKEALAEALQYTKGHPLYLYWHNPKIA